jgi:glycine/D-amino acid oxidase-like deaminating enzyme
VTARLGRDNTETLLSSRTSRRKHARPASPKARVIVIGGGMAGATVAKYLRLWGDAIDVTLVERSPSYTSCIMSSLVLTGQRTLSAWPSTTTRCARNTACDGVRRGGGRRPGGCQA